jgi:hypothetical protein
MASPALGGQPAESADSRPSPRRRWAQRWIAVWLLLQLVEGAGTLIGFRLINGRVQLGLEEILDLLLIPPAQTAALMLLVALHRDRR